jgi:hypothetical protein
MGTSTIRFCFFFSFRRIKPALVQSLTRMGTPKLSLKLTSFISSDHAKWNSYSVQSKLEAKALELLGKHQFHVQRNNDTKPAGIFTFTRASSTEFPRLLQRLHDSVSASRSHLNSPFVARDRSCLRRDQQTPTVKQTQRRRGTSLRDLSPRRSCRARVLSFPLCLAGPFPYGRGPYHRRLGGCLSRRRILVGVVRLVVRLGVAPLQAE